MARYHDEEYYEDDRPRYTRASNAPAWTMTILMLIGLIVFGAYLAPDLLPKSGTPAADPPAAGRVGNQAPPDAVRRAPAPAPAARPAPDAPISGIAQSEAEADRLYQAAITAGEQRAAPVVAPAAQPLPLNSAGAFKRADELAGDGPRTARHVEQAAQEIAAPAPDLADTLKRLDAHGYAKTTTRQKGSTTSYSFRDYGSQLDHGEAGEIELAEGELPFWLSELDDKAARERFLALGWTLTRDGMQFRLDDPEGKHYATSTMVNHLRTLATFESGAAKRAAAAQSSAPTLADLDASLPADLTKAGYFWHSASPPTIAHNDGWRGDARTVESALEQIVGAAGIRDARHWARKMRAEIAKASGQ